MSPPMPEICRSRVRRNHRRQVGFQLIFTVCRCHVMGIFLVFLHTPEEDEHT